ncbi:hypothetical protein FRC02_003760 [Tulasnella sp. 418]|nr:hypothetical protein FRC02_003760 [Tulasnella sp. 418]
MMYGRLAVGRTFVTSSIRFGPALHSDKQEVRKGSEGLHPKDEFTAPSPSSPVHPRGEFTGDWVLMHPVYTPEEVNSVQVVSRPPETIKDRMAERIVKLARLGFDLVSGYQHKEIPPNSTMSLEELRKGGYALSEVQWLRRILFLESIAGVPGMVAATLRHLRSLRLMRRDGGWIHTLLEESENERMHLMTFMTLKKPSIFFRAVVLGAQGVFYNAFFLSYLMSPTAAHRFVGKLEEEAVRTYTACIQDIEEGRLPEWKDKAAPSIAIDYWRLPKDATMLDVVKVVRADEATHRFVNHSFANLDHKQDVNPFALREPSMELKGTKPGLDRSESAEFVKESQKMLGGKPQSKPLEKDEL